MSISFGEGTDSKTTVCCVSDGLISGVVVKICIMPRLTVTLTEEQAELVCELSGDGEPYESKSEVVRNLIQAGERVEELEAEVERLEQEKRLILEERQEKRELARYVEDELSYREAGLATRVRWWLFGKGSGP